MLVDPRRGTPASAGDAVQEAAAHWFGAEGDQLVEREFKMEQTEIASAPTTDIAALRDELTTIRRTVAAAAGSTGVRVVALATTLPGQPDPSRTNSAGRSTPATSAAPAN